MSGETSNEISSWTTDSLRAFVLDRFASEHAWIKDMFIEHQKWSEEKFQAARELRLLHEQMNSARDDAQDKAVAAALADRTLADQIASTANEKRLDNVNEFRGTTNDVIATMWPRSEGSQRVAALELEVRTLKESVAAQQARSGGQSSGWELVTKILPIIIAALAIYLSLKAQTSPVTLK